MSEHKEPSERFFHDAVHLMMRICREHCSSPLPDVDPSLQILAFAALQEMLTDYSEDGEYCTPEHPCDGLTKKFDCHEAYSMLHVLLDGVKEHFDDFKGMNDVKLIAMFHFAEAILKEKIKAA